MPRDQRSATSRFSRHELAVAGFTAAYMLVSLMAAVAWQNREFVFYLVVMFVLIVVVTVIHLKVRLHRCALWGLSLWGLAHMAGGLMPIPHWWPRAGDSQVLYNLWLIPRLLKYDQLVHAYGFGLVTWICWQGLQRAFVDRGGRVEPTLGLLTLCGAAGMGFGAANEVVEFIATLAIPDTNVGGYYNTGWDLVANSVGCLIASLAIRFVHRRIPERQH